MREYLSRLWRGFERIPLLVLAVFAAWLALAPVFPEPHLIEKWRMLWAGTLVRPIDIFDWVLHTLALLLLGLRLGLALQASRKRKRPRHKP